MSDDTRAGSSAEGSPEEPRKDRRIGVVLCMVSAVATLAAVILVAGYMLLSGEPDLRDIAPATGATSK
jgi:hypothetical protein